MRRGVTVSSDMSVLTSGQRGVNAQLNQKVEKVTLEKSVGDFYEYGQNQVTMM